MAEVIQTCILLLRCMTIDDVFINERIILGILEFTALIRLYVLITPMSYENGVGINYYCVLAREWLHLFRAPL
jgi:hypothetical protein